MYLIEFTQKAFDQRLCSGGTESEMHEYASFRIDGDDQPESLIVKLTHGFVKHDLSWSLTIGGRQLRFLHTVVDRRARAILPEFIKH